MSNDTILAGYAAYKQITLKGFLEATLGAGAFSTVAWIAAAATLLLSTVAGWRSPGPPVRHLALAILLGVAVNPYASFYDALLLAIPGTVWWSERQTWRRGPWLTVGWLIAVAWCGEQYAFIWGALVSGTDLAWWLPPFSAVGPVATIWLLLAARETVAQARITTTPRGVPDRADHMFGIASSPELYEP